MSKKVWMVYIPDGNGGGCFREPTIQDGWLSIDTAPFDTNIRIIVCTFDDEVEIIYSSDLCHYPEREYPKYWMPVPNPPKR